MSSRWPTGHFHVDPDAPEPYGICDGCGFMYALAELCYPKEWRGRVLAETSLRKCPRCIDVPNPQDKTILLPPDPVPVADPRPIKPYAPIDADAWDEEGATYDDDVSEFDT